MNYIYFIDNFYSNLYYKNTSSFHFQSLSDTSLWSVYNGPDIYGCPIRWRTYKGWKNPLIYIIRWMIDLERNIHWIDVTYAIKGVMIEKLMKLDNISFFCVLNYVDFNYFSIILQMLTIGYLYVMIDYMNDLYGGLNILSFINTSWEIWYLISTSLITLFWHCWDAFLR